MSQESDVLAAIEELERDEIDDLVDMQLRQTRSGYDHNINQPKQCLHCSEETHSVPIKKRMQEIRRLWQSTIQYYEDGERVSEEAVAALEAYRYDEDDSEIVCPGSEFIGPPKPQQGWQVTYWDAAFEQFSLASWQSILPEVQFPRSLMVTTAYTLSDLEALRRSVWDHRPPHIAPRPSVSEWIQRLYSLSADLQRHLYRNSAAVLMPEERPPGHRSRIESILGMPVRYAPITAGYVGYIHAASESGMGAALSDYLVLERAGTEPVIVASAEAVQLAVRSERLFYEPVRFDFRDTATTAPIPTPHRFSELRNMRVHELSSLGYIFVGYKMEVPSPEDIQREPRPMRPGIVLQADSFRVLSAYVVPASSVEDESFADPPAANRRQRRGHQEPREPMWTQRLGGRGRSQR